MFEPGDWVVNIWKSGPRPRVVIQSGMGDPHDTALILDGDFGDLETAIEHAKLLAAKLNGKPYPENHEIRF